MVMTLRLAPLPLAAAALACACSPSFDADLPDVEITQSGLKVPAATAAMATGNFSVPGTFTISSSDTAWAKRMNSNVRVHQVTLVASGGQPNLDFIECARMTVSASGDPEGAIEIMNYERVANAGSGSAIVVDIPIPNDITIPWTNDQTVIAFQVAGQLPTQDWTFNVTFKLSGKITYRD